MKQDQSSISRVEHVFETVVFASRWIQAPLYGGLIVAELLYAYKFLIELWEMVRHINQHEETVFMLGVLGLIDVTMVANLLTMVIIGGYAT
ncbi:MAG: YqhA family protein, partial [Nitrospirota bacterium]|nr:YqhA family protein [Nitrospirota bacterium]